MCSGKVLIVEDNDLNMKLFCDLLLMKGYEVMTSQEGFDAVSIAESGMPNLILMDIQLKGISGIDIIKELKANGNTSKIPVIAITAFTMKNDKDRILESGCDVYMPKPVGIDSFFAAVDKYVKQSMDSA